MTVSSQVDDSGNSIYVVLGRDLEADLAKIRSCTICYGEALHLQII